MIKRRALLGSLLLGSLLPAAAHYGPSRKRVVIIGAGIAGLGAARALRAAGIEPVIVEARDRTGGRIHTSRHWPGLPMDLGASWIHGVKANPVTALARQAGAAMVDTSYDNTLLHIDPALKMRGVRDRGTDAAEAVFDRAMAWAEQQERDISVQAALEAVAPRASLDADRRAQLDFHVSATYEQEYAGGAQQLSAWWIDDGETFGGEDALFPGGYGQIVDHLAQGLDIRLNHIVNRVDTRPDSVTLGFADGTMMEADHVLVTVPLGVLKAGSIAFSPPLSARKLRAIDQLGMGLLNKHWLRFDHVFWPRTYDWHEFLSAEKGKWSEWVSLAKVKDTPVLVVFSAADHAEQTERLGDSEIVADIMATARQMFGNAIPDPLDAQITRWRSDPHAHGSYSFYAVGSGPEDRVALARSEQGRLHFAGEAQNERYPGTVHGALLSGREAAARIIMEAEPNDRG